MVPLTDLLPLLSRSLDEWRGLRLSELRFNRSDAALLMAVGLMAAAVLLLALRTFLKGSSRRHRIALPALLPVLRASSFASVRHAPLVLFLLGLPCLAVALADPYTSFTRQEVSYPGRRISVIIDASSSMMYSFKAPKLGAKAPSDATFFAAVAAAESFVRMRMKRQYRDLVSLIEFGDQAYVLTPFTSDYASILLSLSLLNDLTEFYKFPDQGTTIAVALNQSVKLFQAFDFLKASGNLMIVFSDGQDVKAKSEDLKGLTADEVMAAALAAQVPIYFIRTVFNQKLGQAFSDPIWKAAIEQTGGRFYAAPDEEAIMLALADIDRRSSGTISVTQYASQQTRFTTFALLTALLWTLALVLKLSVPQFQKLS